MNLIRSGLFFVLGLSISALSVAGDAMRGKEISEPCVACHGTDGNSVNPIWPKIAGQHAKYLYSQLVEMQKGEEALRQGPLMLATIQNLTDQDLQDLASFYSEQTMTAGKTLSTALPLGERLYRGGDLEKSVIACAACHAPDGSGNEAANFPRVAGQHAEYLVDQLTKFANGTRRNSPNNMMQSISHKLTQEEMEAVSEFMAGLVPFTGQ